MKEIKDFCPICEFPAIVKEHNGADEYGINCKICGLFDITDDALIKFQRNDLMDKIISVSYWIRQHQSKDNHPIFIDLKKMRSLIVPFVAPNPKEQADKLLLWMGNSLTKPQQKTSSSLTSIVPIIGAYDEMNVFYIAEHLINDELINEESIKIRSVPKTFQAQLTFKGWERYYELQRSNKDSRVAFMAMDFHNSILKRIFDEIIKDAVKRTGFDIRRLDEERRAGLIDDKLRVEIRRSKFLIADLTDDNNGAYWEAGYAEGLGMPVIYICEEEKFEGKKTHFDTNHHLTIQWKDDPESLKLFTEELKSTIRATFPAEAKMEDE